MVKERWWSATDIKHRKHVKACYPRVRVSLGFRDRISVRVKVRVSFRLATFMYSVWPPVSLRVRVSLRFRDRVRVKVRVSFRLATFMYSVCPPVPHFPYAKPQKF